MESIIQTYACEKCSLPFKQGKLNLEYGQDSSQDTLHCDKCGMETTINELKQQESTANELFQKGCKLLDEITNEVETTNCSPEVKKEVLECLEKCLEIQKKVLNKHHSSIAQTHSQLAKTLSFMSRFNEACDHCNECISILKRTDAPNSMELGHQYAKLANYYYYAGQSLEAMNTVETAKTILQRYYDSSHEAMKELEILKKSLLEYFQQTVGPYWSI
jgi:tetratricopeptide (TPR) repeat protein